MVAVDAQVLDYGLTGSYLSKNNYRVADYMGVERKAGQSDSRKPALNSGRPATAVWKA